MITAPLFGADWVGGPQLLWDDDGVLLCRAWREDANGSRNAVLIALPAAEHPTPQSLARLAHEYGLKDELDGGWAARPLQLARDGARSMLVLEDPGGESLARFIGAAMEVGKFLPLAVGISAAVGKIHLHGLVHRDIKPANILVNRGTAEVHVTGFGIASRLPRQRQPAEPPETIAGTLAYMAPEQTGRMNRSVDARSDLYALGVTLYQMLTGCLPFTASDPMEWVHCHIARRPMPPAERIPDIPAPLSAIIMKMLAKSAEDRYQTAAGVESDLRHCLAHWVARGRIDDFPLGERDTPTRLMIPEKLYGRASEIDTLLAAFDRVVKSGRPELILISGYSGIGKSAVVHELHKALVPPRGLFASGKFDQYKRDIPYSTLAQAFQNLTRPLLGRSDAELTAWRDTLSAALGPNARLIADLVPELKLIIGEPPPVPELPPQQAKRRFQLVFRRFIGVFARPEHPLALFLDDLQWLDAATLDLLEDLLTQPDVHHVLLIGAYRDNEVDAAHPLRRRIEAIRTAGPIVQEIALAPLTEDDLCQLIGDALRCAPERAEELARLVHGKTAGNPFFAIQFLAELAEEGLLAFDHGEALWRWDLGGIAAKDYTDNVVDLMVAKLSRLPAETQAALQQFACLGNITEISTLALVGGTSEAGVDADLWEAVRLELIERHDGCYRFSHDRVQEAAYSLVPEASRPETHLLVGRLLLEHIAPENREEAIFEIVNQLNRGAALIASRDEREQLAGLNLIAGRRAKASSAYASALTYLVAGAELLTEDYWQRRHELVFELELNRAECEFLSGDPAAAGGRLAALSIRAANTVEQAAVTCLRVDVGMTLDQGGRAIEVALDTLRREGIHWTAHPTDDDVRCEYQDIWARLGNRRIDELVDLPAMTDPDAVAIMDVLTKIVPPALFTNVNLFALAVCRIVNLSLTRGNSHGSCIAYACLGMIAGPRFGNYPAGFQFGELGYRLVEDRGFKRFQAGTCMIFGNVVMPWTRHVRDGRDLVRRAFETANRIGDLTYAAFSANNLLTNMLAAGDPLADVQREAENSLDFAQRTRFGLVICSVTAQLVLVRSLRGLTSRFGCFDDKSFDEGRFEHQLARPALAAAAVKYWIRKLQARFLAGDHAAAIAAASRAQELLGSSPPQLETVEYHAFGALLRAACIDASAPDARSQHVESLAAHHRQLEIWAENCPENFASRAALAGAEIARIEGRELDAMRLYDRAIDQARAHGLVHCEAVANELAARFYAARGFDKIAFVYLRDAHYGYIRWGADGKVRQLERLHPRLLTADGAASAATAGTVIERMDVEAVFKALQAVSGEILLPGLIETLMKIALQSAGADRGLLILPRGDGYRVAAEGRADGDDFAVAMCQAPLSAADCPEPLLRTVIRTRESVIVDDATRSDLVKDSDYMRRRQPRSILCLPLVKQGRLAGLLYFENSLASHAFTPDRVAVLELLAAQAAISLENTLLYADLQEREARIRRLVDSNIIGIAIFDLQGRVLDANSAFLDMVGYSRDELASGLSYLDMTPPEGRPAMAKVQAQLRAEGSSTPFEREYVRKDGSRVPALVGATLFEGSSDSGVAFVLDLSARKRAEEKYRSLMDQAHDAILVLDGNGVVLEANRTARALLGHRGNDMVGHALTSVMTPAEPAQLDALLMTGSGGLKQLRVTCSDRTVLDLDVSAARVTVAGQDAVMFIARDITQRLQLEQELRQAQKMDAIGRLTGGVAHDFNNILTVITGTTGLLLEAIAHDSKLAEIGKVIDEAAARGGDLTRQLLAFARRQPLQPRDTDVNTLVIGAAKLLRPTLGEHIEIKSMLAEDCWHAMIDPSQLGTALVNLAVNARDAMPGGGRLTFASSNVILDQAYVDAHPTASPGAYVMITVSDTGTGMPAAIRERVFEPFFTTKEIGKGTGLGLSMVYGFVKQSGGHIEINSTEGCGTSMRLYLPRSLAQTAEAAVRPAGALPGGNETVLVVEDDELVRNYVVTQLKSLGYATIAVANGPEALALLDQGAAFDVVFTDLMMPGGMNGRELAGAITRRRPDVPVLYTSGYPEATVIHGDRLDHGVALLSKPYRKADLARMLRQVLASRSVEDRAG